MIQTHQTGQILFTGITVSELLLQIEQIIVTKISNFPTQNQNPSDYLSRKQFAKPLKFSLPTLHDWTKHGMLKSYKIGNRVLYKENEVTNSLERVSSSKFKKIGGNSYEF